MEYVTCAAHRVIAKADFVINHAILHSCDNLTISFHIETLFSLFIIMSKKYKSCLLMVNNFCCSIPKDCTEGGGGL